MRKSLIPVVFLARANSKQEGEGMDLTRAEWHNIIRILSPAEKAGTAEVIPSSGEAPPFLIETLLTPAIRDRISILHITGLPDEEQLRFDSKSGLEAIDLRTIANALAALPKLNLIFLHGCGTRTIVEELLEADVPAVIATEATGPTEASSRIIEAFYTAIAQGTTLHEAFESIREVSGRPYRYIEVPYDSFTRSPDWSAVPKEGRALLPGLYVREGVSSAHLAWRIKQRTPQGLSKTRKRLLAAGIAACLLLFGLGGFSLISYYQQKFPTQQAPYATIQETGTGKEVTQVSGTTTEGFSATKPDTTRLSQDSIERPAILLRDSSAFASDETYNILILPLTAGSTCQDEVPEYEQLLKKRLTELRQFHGLRAEIQLFVESPSMQDVYTPEEIGQSRHADMVVWGQFIHPCDDSTSLAVRYQPLGPRGETIFETPGRAPKTTFVSFGKNDQDQVLTPVLNAVLWKQAKEKLAENRFAQAQHMFQLIRTQETADYAPVFTQLGICYLNLHNRLRAEQLLDHALELDSKYGPAHCYKGHIHRQRGLIDEAWVDYSRAIDYQPGYAEAYYSRGLVHEQVYKFEEAIQDYEDAIRIQPDFSEARERSKVVRQTNKELLDLNRQIRSNSDNAELYFEKAKLLQYQLANHDSALVYYDKGITLKDDNPHGYFERGHLYQYHFLEYDKAIADYQKGLSLKPGYRFALGNLAVIYATRRNDEQCYYYLEEAAKNGYDLNFFIEKAISQPYRETPRFAALLEKYP